MNALQKVKLTKELLGLVSSLKKGELKALEKIKTTKRVLELVSLLGGESVKQDEPPKEDKNIEDKNIFLRQIANDEINVFVDQSKLSELLSIDENSVDMEAHGQAVVNAARQSLKGSGWPVLN